MSRAEQSTRGGECGSDWQPLGEFLACDAGLRCLTDPRDPSRHACFRGCDDAGDCACPSDSPAVLDDCVTNVPELANGVGLCAHCLENREPYTEGDWDCCDAASTHDSGACCHPAGTACATNEDCCAAPVDGAPDAICRRGLCQECVAPGGPYAEPGCCTGDRPVGGFCPNVRFTRSGARVTQGDRCCGSGRYVCEGLDAQCSGAPAETMDCRDNDCDGATDEDFADPQDHLIHCQAAVPPSRDFQGCENLGELGGLWNCSTGAPGFCAITDSWCAYDRLGNPVGQSRPGEECFRRGSDCSSTFCAAGEWCCSANGDGAYCDVLGHIIQPGSSEPVLNLEPPLDCWTPGQLNMEPECSYRESLCYGLVCRDCLAEDGCGFCNSVCLDGDPLGPTGGITCDPRDWLFGDTAVDRCRRSPRRAWDWPPRWRWSARAVRPTRWSLGSVSIARWPRSITTSGRCFVSGGSIFAQAR